MPEGARKWFSYARLTAGIVAACYFAIGLAAMLFIVLLTLGADDGSSEPWRTRDTWFVCIVFIWLVASPISLLISLGLADRNRRYLYICTLLLLLLAITQGAFVLYGLLSPQFLMRDLGPISLIGLIGWLVALYLISIVWSKVRLAERSGS